MEPERQMEIQLGHMCNNRCVFCVSGQRTAMREAFPLEGEPILAKIREAHEAGIRKLTLLGGEPTIQPEFLNVLRFATGLGFDEIVIFTNGVKTSRPSFVDEVLAIGGNFTFRFSFQGANAIAHERTTKKLGSFGRLRESMRNVHARGRRVTVNMCVVRSNYESVADFPSLILPFDAKQLHLDMVRPKDTGVRSDDELRDMIPRYSDMVPHLEKMVAGFPEGFDVNIGNLPFCIAPSVAPWIHHDGEDTITVAIDGEDQLGEGWNKYENKKSDKLKLPTCRECAFDDACSGVYDTYVRFHGAAELVPITPERLRALDPGMKHFFTRHFAPYRARLDAFVPPEPFTKPLIREDSRRGEYSLTFTSAASGRVLVAFRRPGGGVASTDCFSLHLLHADDAGPATVALLRALFAHVTAPAEGDTAAAPIVIQHPVGEDAALLGETPSRGAPLALDPRLGLRLKQLRAQAPFGALSWRELAVRGAGREAHLTLADPAGATVSVTLAVKGAQVAGGYRLGDTAAPPSRELVDGLRRLMGALQAPSV